MEGGFTVRVTLAGSSYGRLVMLATRVGGGSDFFYDVTRDGVPFGFGRCHARFIQCSVGVLVVYGWCHF